MTLFAGIDGGQTSTVAIVGDAMTVLGRGSGPPADLVGEARGSGRQVVALEAALTVALEAAGIDPRARFEAIVAGISGFDAGVSTPPDLAARTARLQVVHDTEIAHAGALAGAAGIVVIAGTGSVALGNDDTARTAFKRAGGWGSFFGDEGSALWIARTGLRRAMLRLDRDERSDLAERAFATFGVGSLRELVHAFAHGELGRPALASFATHVLALAAAGDADACEVRTAAATELSDLASTVDRRLASVSLRLVSYAGGLFADPDFLTQFGEALQDALPHANLLQPASEPALGALARARALA